MKIPSSVEEAKKLLAPLLKERFDLDCKINTELGISESNDCDIHIEFNGHLQDEKIIDDLEEKRNVVQHMIQNLEMYFYSFPWIRPFMISWMVDIKFGNENIFHTDNKVNTLFIEKEITENIQTIINECEIEEQLKNVMNEMIEDLTDGKDNFINKKFGSIGVAIMLIYKELNIQITDIGGNLNNNVCSGGHLGGKCSDFQKDILLSIIYHKFYKAIQANLLCPKIAWFSPEFPNFSSSQEIEKYL